MKKFNHDFSSRFRILKGGKISLVVSALLGSAIIASAAPTGGTVTSGTANISQNGNVTNINQSTQKASINWQGFSINSNETVNFNQPNVNSITLNRVVGNERSVIDGALNANGQVWILNSNGILFNKNAKVNTAGIVATTKDISDADFQAGNYKFSGNSSASVVNMGTIEASESGYVALLANTVQNDGTIKAYKGTVHLTGASEATINLNGNSIVSLTVNKGVLDALVENKGAIIADGGKIYLTTNAVDEILKGVVNNSGILEANSMDDVMGHVEVFAHGGTANISGTIDASAPENGDGGFIETSGKNVNISEDVKITTYSKNGKTGTWLIDPYDIVVASSGGHITGATIATALNSNNVILDTSNSTYGTASNTSGTNYTTTPGSGNGDITINDTIAKTGSNATTLTLKAHNDININNSISSSSGRLNVVLTADQDNVGGGDINFGANGNINTKDGNFYVGSVSGSYDTVTASGQKFTMANGSYINVGAGSLNIKVKDDITLADNSGATGGNPTYSLSKPELYATSQNFRYFNSGNTLYYYQLNSSDYYPSISLTSTNGSILGGSTVSTIADIITSSAVTLSAHGSIGSSSNPIKIQGSTNAGSNKQPESQDYRPPYYMQTLNVTNTLGASYINEINKQIFSTVNLTVGSSTTGNQSIKLINDSITNTGHINVSVNSGTMTIATNGINTEGAKVSNDADADSYNDFDYNETYRAIFPASVYISAPDIILEDNAVKTRDISYHYGTYGVGSYNGMTTYSPVISLSGTNSLTSSASAKMNNIAEIIGSNVIVRALNIGTITNPLEINTSTLTVNNTGGSTYLANANYGNLVFEAYKTAGSHHILSSNGDFFNVTSTGTDLLVETITGTSDGSNFGNSTGINTATQYNPTDGTGVSRAATVSTRSGGIIFQNNSVNTGGQSFTATLVGDTSVNDYSSRVIRAASLYNSNNPVAQIKAGDVYFNVGSQLFDGTIGGNGYDLQIGKGNTLDNTSYRLQVDTYGGDVNIHELTENHFKTIKTNLRTNGNVAGQDIKIDLAGADDINISDDGTLIVLDKDKVNLSSGNRSWDFYAPAKAVRVDSNSLSTGNYILDVGKLYLNGDILTNGGQINLRANDYNKYIALMKSVRIDSNADDLNNSASTGYAGQIFIYSPFSGVESGYNLTVDTSSSTQGGGVMYMYGNATNTAGAYLSGLTLTTKGSANNNDGQLYFYTNGLYSLNGDFTATGNVYANYGLNVDTEQGNTNNAGNINISGQNFYTGNYYATNLNTSTTATGKNGGNINIYDTYYHSALTASQITMNSSGGAGGTSGDIILPSISTTTANANGSQTYTGGKIVLNGDLLSNFGNITLNGDVQLVNDVLIDTWNNTASTKTPTQNGNVVINGGLSATAENKTLTIDTGNNTGSDDFVTNDGTTHNLSDYYTHNAGSVNISGSITNGSYELGALNVSAIKGGDYNNGTNGTITLNGLTTSGNQSYIGNTTNVTGSLTADTIVFDTRTQDTTVTSTGVITANNLLLKGDATDYSFLATNGNKVSKLAANGVKSIAFLNDDVNLMIDSIQSIDGINATETINLATKSSNITINKNIETQDTSDSAIIINAGKDSAAGTSTGGDIIHTGGTVETGTNGRTIFYSGSILGTTGVPTLINNGNFRYNSDESDTNYSLALETSGNYLIYREQPLLSVTPSTASSIYGNAINLANVTGTITGYKNNDNSTTTTGTATFSTLATSTSNAGTYNIAYTTGLLNSLGYGFANNGNSMGEYTIIATASTPSESTKEIEKVITTIVNTQQISQPIIPVVVNPVINTPTIQPTISGGMSLVSQTVQGQPNQVITLSELRTQNNSQENTNVQTQDVRVSLNENSIIELVNGGVTLPDGVDQEFYLVKQDSNDNGAN